MSLQNELRMESIGILAKFTIPLYTEKNKRPVQVGSGFFVQDGSDCYLVSAAHTFEHSYLFYYTKQFQIHKVKGGMSSSGISEIDIGVIKLLNIDLPPYPEVDKLALDISSLKPRYLPRTEKEYITIGYPNTKSNANPKTNLVTTKMYAFSNYTIDENDYEKHGLTVDNNIAIELKLKKCYSLEGNKINFPKPTGISGSPIFVLNEPSDNVDKNDKFFPVVGVATRYRSSDHLMFGADMIYVLAAIKQIKDRQL